MTQKQGIFSKMTYAYANSKGFIKIQPYTVLAQEEKGEGFYHPLSLSFSKF